MRQCVSPEPVLNETRQCSAVATRQSIDVDIGRKNGKGNGLVHCKAYVLLCVANGPCKCKCKREREKEKRK